MMRSIGVVAALSASVRIVLAQSNLPIINTPPSVVECQPAALTFSGGTAPYIISVLPAGQVSAVPLEYLPTQPAAGTYTWNVNLAAGSNITLSIRDNTGALNYASPLVIQPGITTSCLNASAGAAASSAGAIAPVGPAASTTAAATSSVSFSSAPATGTYLLSSPALVTAASGTPTGVNVTTGSPSAYNFTCSQGFLSYGTTVYALSNVTLPQAVDFFRNWTDASPGTLVNSSGTGIDASRTYTVPMSNASVTETLHLNTTNRTTGALHQQWNTNLSAPLTVSGLTMYSALNDLTVYTNATSNTTELSFVRLVCYSDQSMGIATAAAFVELAVGIWAPQLSGTGNATTSAVRRFVKLF